MKKTDILSLYKGLNSLTGLRGVKFTYGVAKNIRVLHDEITALEKAVEADAKFQEYDTARVALAKEHAEKDEKGEAKVNNNQYVITDKGAFEKEHEKLRDEFSEAITARENQLLEYKSLLEENVEVELHKINISQVPEDISTEQMFAILPIIEE